MMVSGRIDEKHRTMSDMSRKKKHLNKLHEGIPY